MSGFVVRLTDGSSLNIVGGHSPTLAYATARGAPVENESSIDKTSLLTIGTRAIASGSWLNDKGTIIIQDGGVLNNNAAGSTYSTVEAGGKIIGVNGGMLAGSVVNAGVIEAAAGNFHVTASVTSSTIAGVAAGSFLIDSHAVLDLGNNTNQGMTFLSNAELDIEKGFMTHGLLRGFTTGDKIDFLGQTALPGQTVPAINVHAGLNNISIIDFTNGRQVVQEVTLQGSYSSSNLYAQADGHGGTIIGFGQAPGSIRIS